MARAVFEDEGALRLRVAAEVQEASSAEAAAEREQIEAAWRAMSQAQRAVLAHQRTLRAIDASRGAAADDVVDVDDDDEREATEAQLTGARQALQAAQRRYVELSEAAKVNKDARLARAEAELRAQEVKQEDARAAAASGFTQSNAALSARAGAGTLLVPMQRRQPGYDAAVPVPAALALNGAAAPAAAAAAGRRRGRGAAAEVQSTALIDYRGGGDVLPSTNAVTLPVHRRRRRGGLFGESDEDVAERELADAAAAKRKKKPAPKRGQRGAAAARDDDDSGSTTVSELESTDEDAALEDEEGEEGDGEEEEADPTEEDLTPIAIDATGAVRAPRYVWEALLPYQQDALRWMAHLRARRMGGILGDEMGLGKTVQVAAFVHALSFSGMLNGPVLIVAPLTLLIQWRRELRKWCRPMKTVVLHSLGGVGGASGTTHAAAIQRMVRGRRDVVVLTTYSTATLRIEEMLDAAFDLVVLDEGHKISNPNAGVTLACKSFVTPHRLILSGSPIQNSLQELWCLFDFVCPGLLGSLEGFIRAFDQPIRASRTASSTPLQLATAVECARTLRGQIAPFLLRRLKRDVNRMLPPKVERVIRCALTDAQLQSYLDVLASQGARGLSRRSTKVEDELRELRGARDFEGGLVLMGVDRRSQLKGMMHQAWGVLAELRLLCNHVDLHTVREGHRAETAGAAGAKKKPAQAGISFRSNRAVNLEGSAKLTALMELLHEWRRDGHKALVFSQTRMMLDILENAVDQAGFRYVRLDGTTHSVQRADLVHVFNHDATIPVALLTTRVGGLGLNLTGADRVVLFDPDWNPCIDEQARERAWRIGQTREVHVYRMITGGTVEEHILHRQMAKSFVTEKVLADPTLQRFFSVLSLVDAFKLGPEYAARVHALARRDLVAGAINFGAGGAAVQHEVEQAMRRENAQYDDVVAPGRLERAHVPATVQVAEGHVDEALAAVTAEEQAAVAAAARRESVAAIEAARTWHIEDAPDQDRGAASGQSAGPATNGTDDDAATGLLAALVDGSTTHAALRRAQSTTQATQQLAQLAALQALSRAVSHGQK